MMSLSTHDEVIDALGGNQAVAQMFDVGLSAVSNWKKDGFPARTFPMMTERLAHSGKYAPQELWNIATPRKREAAAPEATR